MIITIAAAEVLTEDERNTIAEKIRGATESLSKCEQCGKPLTVDELAERLNTYKMAWLCEHCKSGEEDASTVVI